MTADRRKAFRTLGAIALGFLILSMGSGPAVVSALAAGAAIPVVADVARRTDVPVFLLGLGSVAPLRTVTVTSRIDGQLVKLDFTDGQDVHAGDLLAEIDPEPLQAALGQAQATKTRDDVSLANARLDLARAQTLTTKGVGSTQVLDTAKATVAQLEATDKVDQAAIDIAQIQLGFTQIRSPLDGRVGIHMVDAGNIVRASDTGGIVRISQIHPIAVDFSLPSDALPRIQAVMKAGNAAVVAQDNGGQQLASGRLSVVDNQINGATATIRIRAVFDNADDRLWPGQFVNVRVQADLRRGVVTVPVTAIVRGPEGTYVFVVGKDRHIVKRPVTVAYSNAELAVVGKDVQPGDTVVTDGQYRIQEGDVVDVTGPAQAAN
ncbi:efflux RND transporter periplasmic adaptor subunit [Mesorhizobium sp. B2-4-12]|uniref:efflux RND transporter periplasmic adaptor subunit n=1 Tax=unclassified Mesorhizobium TaxID=325217 RepID=UPI00112628AB|nr:MULTISPECIES: efflux RND transporter periplasmic adaptor subunit [unclassified Mesorhizobium]TPK83014.1 efflux RND transporter periplasmic adaptor subunit [Mesorhizobium sp. B2-4-17]TPK92673.1 efflux RND transporter periplasmic adaptor subunit [Mesorhizobium sp. B2-4-12]